MLYRPPSAKPQVMLTTSGEAERHARRWSLEDRLSDPDPAAGTENNHLPVGILCAENQQFGGEPCDVLGSEIADADNQRAYQRLWFVVRDLGARPHDPIGPDVDADLVGRVARPGKGLDFDDLAYPDVETGKIVVGCLGLQLSHIADLGR